MAPTKAELQRNLDAANARIAELEASQAAKPDVPQTAVSPAASRRMANEGSKAAKQPPVTAQRAAVGVTVDQMGTVDDVNGTK